MIACAANQPRPITATDTAMSGRDAKAEMRTCRSLPAGEFSSAGSQFQALDPDIVSETIPAFYVGSNKEGFWVARDAKGDIGGIFLFQRPALSFAKTHSRPTGCATIFPFEPFELALGNDGNKLAAQLVVLKRFARRMLRGFAPTSACHRRC
jgi:hypothetical protein